MLSLIFAILLSSFVVDGFTYDPINERVALISAQCPDSEKELIIPQTVTYQNAEYTVFRIDANCFKGCHNWIGSIDIPSSITTIGESCFEDCVNLNGELHLHDAIGNIFQRAFYGCTNLKFPNQDVITLPPLSRINAYTFYGCSSLSINTFQISESTTTINGHAFEKCSSLKGRLILPDSLTTINEYAFSECNGFTSLHIPQLIRTIQRFAFNGCTGFKGDLLIANTGVTIGESAFNGCTGFDGKIVVYGTPRSIGTNAFKDLQNIKSINYYGNSFSNNGINVFEGINSANIEFCSSFDNETFFGISKESATQIEDYQYSFDSTNNEATIVNGICAVLKDSTQIPTATSDSGVQHPVKTLGPYSFSFITTAKNLVIPDGIKSIDLGAFIGSTGLTSNLVIPNSIENIGDWCFYGAGYNGELTLSTNLHLIGSHAFQGCRLTGTLTIPKSVESIGDNAFASISTFRGLIIFEFDQSSDSDSSSSLRKIGRSAFYSCSNIVGDLILPDSVTEIGESAFEGMLGLRGVLHIPTNLKVIEDSTFNRMRYISGDLVIPESVTAIGPNAFSNCGFNGTIFIPNTVTSIGENSFMNCQNFIGDLIIPDSVSEIPAQAFSGCGFGNGTLRLPSGLTTIGDKAFQITKFTGELSIPSSVTYIGADSFQRSTITGDIALPLHLKTLGRNSFSNCAGLKGILSFGDEIDPFPDVLFDNTDFNEIHFYGSRNIQDCGFLQGKNVDVSVLTNFDGNNLCGIQVDKNLVMPTNEPDSDDGLQPGSDPETDSNNTDKNKDKLGTGPIIGIVVACVVVVAVVVVVVVIVIKRRKKDESGIEDDP